MAKIKTRVTLRTPQAAYLGVACEFDNKYGAELK